MEEYPIDTWVKQSPHISPLKINGDSVPGHSKKWKIDFGKSTVEEIESCRPFVGRHMEDISSDIRAIKKLVLGLPQGSGELSTRHHSYMYF